MLAGEVCRLLEVAFATAHIAPSQRDRREAAQRPQAGQVIGWRMNRLRDLLQDLAGFAVATLPAQARSEARQGHDPPSSCSCRFEFQCPSVCLLGPLEIAN